MKKIINFHELSIATKYHESNKIKFNFKINNLSTENGIKEWNTEYSFPAILALFGNDEDNLNNIIKAMAGYANIKSGEILIDDENVTYIMPGWERRIAIFGEVKKIKWNKLFSVKKNLLKSVKQDPGFLQRISILNTKTKAEIANLKNTGLIVDRDVFKEKLILLLKKYIDNTTNTRKSLVDNYFQQIQKFHSDFAEANLNFVGSEPLKLALIKKFIAEDNNIIANNTLLFFQALEDRIESLKNLVGDCPCGCNPTDKRKKEFRLKEIIFVVKKINQKLEADIYSARQAVRATLKNCNSNSQVFAKLLNELLAYQKVTFSRAKIEKILEEWTDHAEVQRIKFNMKQEFVSMQILPDEMQNLIKKIKAEVKVYHAKLLTNPDYDDQESYNLKLKRLLLQLIDYRDLTKDNINTIFNLLKLNDILPKKINELTFLEKRIVQIVQQIISSPKLLVLENPFELLEKNDKQTLAKLLKLIAKQLKIMLIFVSKDQKDIELIASDICIIENQNVIQEGKLKEITAKPLSLNLFKEMNNNHVNITKGDWYPPDLVWFDIKIGNFRSLEDAPIIAIKATDIFFSFKKPKFNFFYKNIIIKCSIKSINKVDEKYSYITVNTYNNELYEVRVNNNDNFQNGEKGFIVISKNAIYIFDSQSQQLIGTR